MLSPLLLLLLPSNEKEDLSTQKYLKSKSDDWLVICSITLVVTSYEQHYPGSKSHHCPKVCNSELIKGGYMETLIKFILIYNSTKIFISFHPHYYNIFTLIFLQCIKYLYYLSQYSTIATRTCEFNYFKTCGWQHLTLCMWKMYLSRWQLLKSGIYTHMYECHYYTNNGCAS